MHFAALAVAHILGSHRGRSPTRGMRVLLTGTFHSENWIMAHVLPLSLSVKCSHVVIVSTTPVPKMTNVSTLCPPHWLVRLVGPVVARLIVFTVAALRLRPDIVGGFHLLLNGLWAQTVARLVGARSLYFCVGGPTEVVGGGAYGENRLFRKLAKPDHAIEAYLLRAVRRFDLIVVMGTKAADYFRRNARGARCWIVPGGIAVARFTPPTVSPEFDLVVVARLVPVKRLDRFLCVIREVAVKRPDVSAVVLGDGPLRASLEAQARQLGVDSHIRFVGHQSDVTQWLRRARVFVLTSDSEGLALSLIEAMACGLPAVVSNVGDLADLVQDGSNGYLITDLIPSNFAGRIIELLRSPALLREFSAAARRSALSLDAAVMAQRWDLILSFADNPYEPADGTTGAHYTISGLGAKTP